MILPKLGGGWQKKKEKNWEKNGGGPPLFFGGLDQQRHAAKDGGQPFTLNYNGEDDYSGAAVKDSDRPDVVGPIRLQLP